MSKPKRGRKPRIKIPESTQPNWRAKVHPFFVRMLEYDNQVAKLRASPNEADQIEAQRLTRNHRRNWLKRRIECMTRFHRRNDRKPTHIYRYSDWWMLQ